MKRLSRKFFARPTLKVARDLLGKCLVRKIRNKKITFLITEVEAYCGPEDLASHARHGKTFRNSLMWGLAGHAYIYFVYGMYHCFNIVTEKEETAGAVLIRSTNIITGPGKLCKLLKLDKKLNGEDLVTGNRLWLEDPKTKIKLNQIKTTKRIGIDYAGSYKGKPWRFVLELNQND